LSPLAFDQGWFGGIAIKVFRIIVSETATDAMSAGIFVLGPEKGMALIERLPQIEGLIIDREGKVFVSSGLRSRLVWRDSH